MIKNYIKLAIRNILNNKGFSFINISGLAVGMASAIMIMLFVKYEFSYDKYHDNADNIYRVAMNWNKTTPWARIAYPIAPLITNEFPEISHAVRIRKNPRTDLIEYKGKQFNEERFYFADPDVFKVFSFPLTKGDPETALRDKNSLVLTESMVKKYFGDEDPVGKVITFEKKIDFLVTGVLKEVPSNSHFVFDFLATFDTLEETLGTERVKGWAWFDSQTYILLSENTDASTLEGKFESLLINTLGENYGKRFNLFLQPLTSIHLYSHIRDELEVNSSAVYSYVLSTIAFFIIIMAGINFMNISTANYSGRSVEVGMRKVLGAHRIQLIRQYMTESIVLSLISLVLGVIITVFALPIFRNVTERDLSLTTGNSFFLFAQILAFGIFVGIFSGSYPSLYLSNLKPVKVLKGMFNPGTWNNVLRKGLVVFQFCLSMILIFSTYIISDQLEFFRKSSLGFNKDQILVIPIKDRSLNHRFNVVSELLKKEPSILNVSYSSSIPGNDNSMTFGIRYVGDPDAKFLGRATYLVDYNFIDLYEFEIIEGRNFSREITSDSSAAVILNESAVRFFGLESPIGEEFYNGRTNNKVIGVVKDFNFRSLHHTFEPLIFTFNTSWYRFISVKVKAGEIQSGIDALNRNWSSIFPGRPLEYSFLDDNIAKQYENEQKLSSVFYFFSVIAIVIAGLGLIGLGTFTINKRTKEIGIRKVLGGTSKNITYLLLKDFFVLILISLLITWPLAYNLMENWLSSFAHRITIGIGVFIVSLGFSSLILLLTLGFQTLKAALRTPIHSLRYE